jgi:CBS domain-containing protein
MHKEARLVMTNREMSEIVRNQKPLTLPPETTIQAACKHMHERRVGAVMVVDAMDRLIGIFTGRDAVRCLARGRPPAETALSQVMTRRPATMAPDSTAIEALRLMRDGGFRHVPVVEGDRLIGVVSRGDFRGLEQDRLDEETGLWQRI